MTTPTNSAKLREGRTEGYTKEQIAEYGLHLNHLAACAQLLSPKVTVEEVNG